MRKKKEKQIKGKILRSGEKVLRKKSNLSFHGRGGKSFCPLFSLSVLLSIPNFSSFFFFMTTRFTITPLTVSKDIIYREDSEVTFASYSEYMNYGGRTQRGCKVNRLVFEREVMERNNGNIFFGRERCIACRSCIISFHH